MKKRYLLALPLAAISLIGITSCGKDDGGEITTPVESTPTTSTTTEEVYNYQSLQIDTTSVKKNYFIGEELSLENLKVTAKYLDGTTKEITDYIVDQSGFNNTKAGSYYIKISYEEEGVTKVRNYLVFVTSILDDVNYVVGVTATGMKTEYSYQEELDLSGLEVTAYYKDGTSKALESSDYTVDSTAFNSNMRGNYEIAINYSETYTAGTASDSSSVKTCFFANVIMNMESITVRGTGTYYQYEDLSTSDWTVTIKYEEGVSETISSGFTTNLFDVFENGNTSSGFKSVTVTYSYNGKTCTALKSCRILGVTADLNAGGLTVCNPQVNSLEVDSTFTILSGYSVLSDSNECGTQGFTKSIVINGTGTREENGIKLTLTAGAKIDICVSSDEGSTFGFYDGEGNPISVLTAGSDVKRYSFKASTAGTYYIWGASSINVYYVGIWNS